MSIVHRRSPLALAISASLFAVAATSAVASPQVDNPAANQPAQTTTQSAPASGPSQAAKDKAAKDKAAKDKAAAGKTPQGDDVTTLSEITVVGVRASQMRAIELKRDAARHPGQHHGGKHRHIAGRDHHRCPAARDRRADQPRSRRGHLGGRARPARSRHHVERRSVHHAGSDRFPAARFHHAAGHAVPWRGRDQVAHGQPDRRRHQRLRSTCTPIGPGIFPADSPTAIPPTASAAQHHQTMAAGSQRPGLLQRRWPLGLAGVRRFLRHHADNSTEGLDQYGVVLNGENAPARAATTAS